MSNIQSDIKELNELDNEIKRLSISLRNVRTIRKNTETRISDFLSQKNQPGVKYNGNAIILEKKQKRAYMSKKAKEEGALSILQKYNINNSKSILDELRDSMKGNSTDIFKLKITKIKN
jgi:hypothetical protein